MPRRILALVALFFLAFAAPASAAVIIAFYSHDTHVNPALTIRFPHGFVLLSGATESGEAVNAHLGFSSKTLSMKILWGPVEGALDDERLTDAYIAQAQRHFSFPISDAQYRAVMAVEHKWRTWPQPSYEIDTHNCTTFVKEIAVAAGLVVSDDARFIRKPRSFLDDVASRNAAFLASAQAAPANLAVTPDVSPGAPAPQSRASAPVRDWATSAPN